MEWLKTRTPRERGLIYTALGLISFLACWQFLIGPVSNGYSDARDAQSKSVRDYEIVTQGLSQMSGGGGSTGIRPFDSNAIIAELRGAGLGITRVQPGRNSEVQIWLDDAEAPRLFSALERLNGQFAMSVSRAQVTRQDSGLVSMRFTVEPKS